MDKKVNELFERYLEGERELWSDIRKLQKERAESYEKIKEQREALSKIKSALTALIEKKQEIETKENED